MHLVVGLGNPGKEYSGSRHNLGFQAVELLSRRLKTGRSFQKHWSLCSSAEYMGSQVILAQPLTYMNRSGRAVLELVRNYHVDLSNLLIICDDLDLPPGMIRLRKKGGSAGHNGIQSIIDSLGTAEFPRLKIGIGKPHSDLEGADYVLQPPDPPDLVTLNAALDKATEAVLLYISDGLDAAMNIFNQGLPSAD
jgi:peptidyl-tRNA hydrolase, PTH1 family